MQIPHFRRVQSALRDRSFRDLLRNSGLVLTGSGVASLLNLGAFALTARALAPEGLGIVALVRSTTMAVAAIASFQSWQAVIKFGAEALEGDRSADFRALIRTALLVDGLTSLAAMFVAMAASAFMASRYGWDRGILLGAWAYAGVALFQVSAVPAALLRLYNRYRVVMLVTSGVALLNLAAVGVAWSMGAGVREFLVIAGGFEMLGHVLVIGIGLRTLHARGHGRWWRTPETPASRVFHGLWRFMWTTNLQSSVKRVSTEADVLLVGAILGEAATGVYKVVRQFAVVPGKFSDALYQVLYPELSRLWARREVRAFRRMLVRVGLLTGGVAGAIWIGFSLFAPIVIRLTVGEEFTQASPVAIFFLSAAIPIYLAFPCQRALLAMGRPMLSFLIWTGGVSAYLGVLPIALARWELYGAAGAHLAFQVLLGSVLIAVTMRYLTRAVRSGMDAGGEPIPVESQERREAGVRGDSL